MNTHLIRDWVLSLILYALYALVIVLAVQFNLPSELGVTAGGNGDRFLDEFQTWAFVALGISLTAVLFWYIIGEWGPQPHSTRASSWLLFWLIGLILAIAGGIGSDLLGPQPSAGGEILAVFYIGTAFFFYYIATLLFSPTNVKYVVPGAKLFRRW